MNWCMKYDRNFILNIHELKKKTIHDFSLMEVSSKQEHWKIEQNNKFFLFCIPSDRIETE